MRDHHPLPGADHLVDGVRLHVVHHGDGDGLPVLLLHGIPTSSYLWRDVQRDLGHRHRTLAPDLVGLGCSERPPGDRYDLASQAALLLGLLDSLGHDRVVLAGHDVGGGVALHLTALAPERVAALVLVDAPAHADAWPVPAVAALRLPVVGETQTAVLRLVPGAGERLLGTQLGKGVVEPLPPKVLSQYAAPLLSPDGARGLLGFARALDPAAVEAALRIVATSPPPTLVLWGDADPWLNPSYGRRLVDDIPGARFVCVPDAGHFLPEDRPERVAEEVDGFLAEV